MANPRYKFFLHQGNPVEGETFGDPFNDDWVVVKRANHPITSVQMAWVTRVESYSAESEDSYEQT